MTNAVSLHIGLNYCDSTAYPGWDSSLAGCVNDALAMQKIADGLGYTSILLLNEDATADRIIAELGQAAFNLDPGGIFLLTYSGHGGQMPDVNRDEVDGRDETWVVYDRQLIDDELNNLWSQFPSDARIVVLSDSCHSGTVTRGAEYKALTGSGAYNGRYRSSAGPARFRAMPDQIAMANYEKHRTKYDALQFAAGRRPRSELEAQVLLISGCQDSQLSSDGDTNGLFTEMLLKTWKNGTFQGGYRAFHKAIAGRMPAIQSPNYFTSNGVTSAFEAQLPFTVEQPVRHDMEPVQNSTSAWPSIVGPNYVPRSAPPPTFSVNAGPGRYFVVEIAAEPELFDVVLHGQQRSPENFYGSWSDTALMTGSSYTLPSNVWQRLRADERLYYRIGTSASPTAWKDYRVSHADQAGNTIPAVVVYE